MYLLADFTGSQEHKEEKGSILPWLAGAGALAGGATAAALSFSGKRKKNIKTVLQETNIKDKLAPASGYLGLDKKAKQIKLQTRKSLLREAGTELNGKSIGKKGLKLEAPDSKTGRYNYVSAGNPNVSKRIRKSLNKTSQSANKLGVITAQEIADKKGVAYNSSNSYVNFTDYNDEKYWDGHRRKKEQLVKKYKTDAVETQFDDNDEPIFYVKDNKTGYNYIHDSKGKLKEKIKQQEEPALQQKKKRWLW